VLEGAPAVGGLKGVQAKERKVSMNVYNPLRLAVALAVVAGALATTPRTATRSSSTPGAAARSST